MVCTLSFAAGRALAARWFLIPHSPRTASYQIDVTLDPGARTLRGEETLVWRNPSDDVIQELQFHLYLNAFRNAQSTHIQESFSGLARSLGDSGWGSIDITSLRTESGDELVGRLSSIHPDDENDQDRTVMRLPLQRTIGPRQSVTLRISFTARLPRLVRRTGQMRDFVMAGQWFPKIGVYEPAGMRGAVTGRWNCHQFHANTEFYADFGVYDVTITTPSSMIVGATGSREEERLNPDGTRTVRYHAEDVHDFAWTASPHFVEVTDRWRHVSLRALLQPSHRAQAVRYFQALKASLDYLNLHVGTYPYPVLTIVDPPYFAPKAGGMEYPTLFTAETTWGMPGGVRLPEIVVVHELTHDYFHGMVASNEFEEAWLDEGFTQYFEARIMDETYGADRSALDVAGVHFGDLTLARELYVSTPNPRIAPPATPGWKFPLGGYGAMTYYKTAVVLATMERLLGRAAMDSVMRTYFRRWSFRHPSGADFVATAVEVANTFPAVRHRVDLASFFDQTLYGTGICDYEVSALASRRIDRAPGDTTGSRLFRSTVLVSRLGEVALPLTIRVRFDDGSTEFEEWDGRDRTLELRYDRSAAVAEAVADPDATLLLDVNRINNSKTFAPPRAVYWEFAVKALFWLQNLFATLGLLG
jgi:hypothetical protein